jgi:hypothetical protein
MSIVIQLNARAEECFFVATESRNGATCQVAWQTQLGATLEIDVDIHDPRESLIYSAIQEPEGQTAFVAAEGGRYRVCFSNVNNGQYPKFVAFRIKCTEIPDEHEVPVTPPPRTPFNGTRFCRAFQPSLTGTRQVAMAIRHSAKTRFHITSCRIWHRKVRARSLSARLVFQTPLFLLCAVCVRHRRCGHRFDHRFIGT